MNSKTNKQALLDQLYAPYQNCLACPLGKQGRTRIVFGDGDPDSAIFFIGEAPGAQEDRNGIPFVGKAGKLLNKALNHVNLKRENVFISNIVKCRPPKNRKPLPLEIKTCKSLILMKQIRIVNPKIIFVLGATALEGLIEKKIKISHQRGKSIDFNGIIVVPTYHPSYIARNPKLFEVFTEDLRLAIKKSQDL
ncbi:MAG: uracil-DNA glycosylase [Candidatus Dependentiae bacterium]|nr:uracil-DNA glycosylase [Candidatus Dependentiae bacterium]